MANTQTTVPTFIPGQVLEAAQLVNSAATGVPVFATTVTRDAGFGGAGEKTLAKGQLCYLEATDVVQYYNGAAWATLAPAPAVSSGLVLISATTITGASVNIANCFSATYRNYQIIGDSITGATAGYELEARFGVSGTPTSANYAQSNAVGGNTAATIGRISLSTIHANQGFIMEVYAPNVAATTMFTSVAVNTGDTGRMQLGYQTDSTAFTDLNFQPQAGSTNFSGGTVRIYGYANS
jgi:hypothetical protein